MNLYGYYDLLNHLISPESPDDHLLAEAFVHDELYQKLALNMGNPGDMIGGNSLKTFSSDEARPVIRIMVNEDVRDSVRDIHLGCCAVVKVLNSQKRKVNVEALRKLCTKVLLIIVEVFPWVVISQSVRRILAH